MIFGVFGIFYTPKCFVRLSIYNSLPNKKNNYPSSTSAIKYDCTLFIHP